MACIEAQALHVQPVQRLEVHVFHPHRKLQGDPPDQLRIASGQVRKLAQHLLRCCMVAQIQVLPDLMVAKQFCPLLVMSPLRQLVE